MTRTSRACGFILMYCLLAGLLACTVTSAQEVNADFTEGVRLFQEKAFGPAIEKLETVVEDQPESEAAWYYLGVARFEEENLQGALDALQKAYDLRPGRPGTQLYIGQIYEQLGAYDEALRAYQTELRNRRFKNLAEVFTALGRAYYYSGQYDEAISRLTEALDVNENYVDAAYYRGLAHHVREDYEEAMEDFDLAVEICDEWNRLHNRVGEFEAKAEKGELTPEEQRELQRLRVEIAQDYGRAQWFVQDENMRDDLYIDRGNTAQALDKWAMARNSYRKLFRDSPGLKQDTNPLPYVKIGQAYFGQAQQAFYKHGQLLNAITTVDTAIGSVEEGLEYGSDFPVAHKTLGDIFYFQASTYVSDPDREIVSSNYEDALARYDAAIAGAPDYVEAYIGRAQTHIAMDEPGNAIQDIQTALDLAPRNADLYATLARAQMQQENYQEAISSAQTALNLERHNAEAHNAAGLAHYYLGDLAAAREHFSDAIEADPTLDKPYINLGNTFYQMASWPAARRNYNEALELIPKSAIANTALQRSYLHLLIARTYHHAGQYEREVEALDEALKLDPTYVDALIQIASAYVELEKFESAATSLDSAIDNLSARAPREIEAEIFVRKGRLYEKQGLPYKAVEAYARALEAESENMEARNALQRLTSR